MNCALRFGLGLAMGLLATTAWAGERGTTGADVLKLGAGAAASGRGEAYTAEAGSLQALQYNPAGVSGLDMPQVSATHLNWIADTQYETVAAAWPWVGIGTTALSVGWLHMPDIPALDENGGDLGAVRASDLAAELAFARDLSPWIAAGLSGGGGVKLLRRELAGVSAFGAALDIGALYAATERLTLGLALNNLGTLSRFENGSESLPLTARVGARYALPLGAAHALVLALDGLQPLDNGFRCHAGAEYTFQRLLILRLGYKLGYDTDSFQVGGGVHWQAFSLDYAAKSMGIFGLTHIFSLSVGLGASVQEQQETGAQRILQEAEKQYTQSQYPEALRTVERALVIDARNPRALELRDKLRSVLNMLGISPEIAPAAPAGGHKPATADEREEQAPEVKP